MARGGVFDVRDDDRALRRVLLGAMAVGFAGLLAAAVATWWNTQRAGTYTRAVEHTYQVIETLSAMQIALEQSETARRGFLLSGDPAFERTYRAATATLPQRMATITQLSADNPRQVDAARRVRRNLDRLSALRDRSIALVRDEKIASAFVAFQMDGSVELIRAIRARLRAMMAEEDRLLVERSNAQIRSTQLFLSTLGIAGVLIVLVAILSLFTVLRFIRDLGASRATLQQLNDSLEDQVAERTTDLTRANEEIQRFAYIVSHDLRSPLVNVMGFTAELEAATGAIAELLDRADERLPEIVTQEARDAARTDLPEAIGFIRSSTTKMDRLINAILKLSREGRRAIAPEAIDMTAMISGIRDTIQHRLDERDATLSIEGRLPDIVSDRLAIEQVFGNVIDNAVKYFDAARPGRIVVRGRTERGRALFEVEDNGRGIDPRDHQRVFDLFRRSGAQDQPGEGIGLAHVRALTYRLGGTIDVASELGRGATFRITLPTDFTELAGPNT